MSVPLFFQRDSDADLWRFIPPALKFVCSVHSLKWRLRPKLEYCRSHSVPLHLSSERQIIVRRHIASIIFVPLLNIIALFLELIFTLQMTGSRQISASCKEMTDQSTAREVPISDSELRALLLDYRRENWNGIQPEETQRRIVDDLLSANASCPLSTSSPMFQISPNSRILDLGSGRRQFRCGVQTQGLRAFGIEPDRIGQGAKVTSIQIARRRLTSPVFVSGVGEELPFPDGASISLS